MSNRTAEVENKNYIEENTILKLAAECEWGIKLVAVIDVCSAVQLLLEIASGQARVQNR